ncbi:MAG: hypothetical protein WCO77_13535 [bacterium]
MDELIRRFNEQGVRYLVIGGQAVRLEGCPRFSMDWDLYIPSRDSGNMALINLVLGEEIDVPVVPMGPRGESFVQTYQTRWGVLQFHLAGPGLPPFDEAERRAVVHQTEEGVSVRCLAGADLLESKKRANRPSDAVDIDFLEKKKSLGLL